jgi:hypothetical protein
MMNLREALDNAGRTENGAMSFKRTGSKVLDFFAHAGALRSGGNDAGRGLEMFIEAFKEDPLHAMITLFYLRDPRQGNGERELFRRCLKWLADEQYLYFLAVRDCIVEYGRWDDLLLFGPHHRVGSNIVSKVSLQLSIDRLSANKGKSVSLIGKWMPSENASSPETRAFAYFWMQRLGYITKHGKDYASYRRLLSMLRERINIPERLMSAGRWTEIDYSTVPSRAMYIYRKAFRKHDPEGFAKYLEQVKQGKKVIHAGVLFPHEIIGKLMETYNAREIEELTLLWEALPNWFADALVNAMCVCDTSGSMSGMPMLVALSLTMYAAERMTGPFADSAISFSAKPQFNTIPRELPLKDRMRILMRGSGYNTNFQAVFELLLDMAKRIKAKQEDMPSTIFCISDMQFDQADGSARPPAGTNEHLHEPTNFEMLRAKYAEAGYEMPLLVMWNVRSVPNDTPVTMMQPGVYLVSGFSPVIFKNALQLNTATVTPYDAMMETLHDGRYDQVINALRALTDYNRE